MKYILVFSFLISTAWAANYPAQMSNACMKKLDKKITESVSSSHEMIMEGLKDDWSKNPTNAKATYSDCGPSDFYYVEVDKATCKIIDEGGGDSDGECSK